MKPFSSASEKTPLPALLPLLFLVLLSACASPGPQRELTQREQAYEERRVALESTSSWKLRGRLGIDDGNEGGSGRLDWDHAEDRAELQFRGALGQGTWRLQIAPDLARLERSDGSIAQAPDVDQLVRQETGWQLPVAALTWWVQGLVWPRASAPDDIQLNDDGTPASLQQLGWTVSYKRYMDHDGQRLPSRLEAVRGDVRVKLAVSRWQGGGPQVP